MRQKCPSAKSTTEDAATPVESQKKALVQLKIGCLPALNSQLSNFVLMVQLLELILSLPIMALCLAALQL